MGDNAPRSHVAALQAELAELPDELATSVTAAAALGLARSLDELGVGAFRFQAGLVAQLEACMESLRKRAPAKEEGDSVDQLSERRAARRRAAAEG